MESWPRSPERRQIVAGLALVIIGGRSAVPRLAGPLSR